jgi:hypothetical protein
LEEEGKREEGKGKRGKEKKYMEKRVRGNIRIYCSSK